MSGIEWVMWLGFGLGVAAVGWLSHKRGRALQRVQIKNGKYYRHCLKLSKAVDRIKEQPVRGVAEMLQEEAELVKRWGCQPLDEARARGFLNPHLWAGDGVVFVKDEELGVVKLPLRGQTVVESRPADGEGIRAIASAEIVRCAVCMNFAVRLDEHYPHMTAENRCRGHLGVAIDVVEIIKGLRRDLTRAKDIAKRARAKE